MRNIIVIVFALNLTFFGYSQDIKMSGLIIDAETKQPIQFVNIGVLNENKGTISNQNGEFNLLLSKEFLNDSLTISHVQYHAIKVPIEDLENQKVFLKPKTTILSEVVVSNKKRKNRKIGVKSYNRLLSIRVTSKTNDIIEVAQKVNIPDKEVYIKAVNFNIRKWSKVEGVHVRINFYKNVDNAPGEKIISKSIVQEIPYKTDNGWIPINITENDIYLSEDFFIGIEFIPNFKTPTVVYLGAILTKGKGYYRERSFGVWEKLNGGASVNVEVEY